MNMDTEDDYDDGEDIGRTKLGPDSGFNYRHYMVFTDKGLNETICPNINHARRVLADAIKHGGEGWILETVEHWQDKGGTFEQIELEIWP
jgi:hypothetical protein